MTHYDLIFECQVYPVSAIAPADGIFDGTLQNIQPFGVIAAGHGNMVTAYHRTTAVIHKCYQIIRLPQTHCRH